MGDMCVVAQVGRSIYLLPLHLNLRGGHKVVFRYKPGAEGGKFE